MKMEELFIFMASIPVILCIDAGSIVEESNGSYIFEFDGCYNEGDCTSWVRRITATISIKQCLVAHDYDPNCEQATCITTWVKLTCHQVIRPSWSCPCCHLKTTCELSGLPKIHSKWNTANQNVTSCVLENPTTCLFELRAVQITGCATAWGFIYQQSCDSFTDKCHPSLCALDETCITEDGERYDCVPPVCTNNTCAENSDCIENGTPNPNCQCKEGYTGNPRITCTELSPCEEKPCGINAECYERHCGANTKCKDSHKYYSCECREGFAGDPNTYCTALDPCESSPCGENAVCTLAGDGYQCLCRDWYTGDPYTICYELEKDPSVETEAVEFEETNPAIIGAVVCGVFGVSAMLFFLTVLVLHLCNRKSRRRRPQPFTIPPPTMNIDDDIVVTADVDGTDIGAQEGPSTSTDEVLVSEAGVSNVHSQFENSDIAIGTQVMSSTCSDDVVAGESVTSDTPYHDAFMSYTLGGTVVTPGTSYGAVFMSNTTSGAVVTSNTPGGAVVSSDAPSSGELNDADDALVDCAPEQRREDDDYITEDNTIADGHFCVIALENDNVDAKGRDSDEDVGTCIQNCGVGAQEKIDVDFSADMSCNSDSVAQVDR